MVAETTRKPGADQVPVEVGNMASATVPGRFSPVFLVFNTSTSLLTQDEQVSCFANAAAHLDPGGYFVIETLVPRLRRLQPGERFIPFEVSADHIGFDEYDLMASLTGMTLAQRWADWNRTPLTAESTSHISVWRRD
jgi:hypothetical protein